LSYFLELYPCRLIFSISSSLLSSLPPSHPPSLPQAFWPALQVLAGELPSAQTSFRAFYSLWKKYQALPEVYDLQQHTLLNVSVPPLSLRPRNFRFLSEPAFLFGHSLPCRFHPPFVSFSLLLGVENIIIPRSSTLPSPTPPYGPSSWRAPIISTWPLTTPTTWSWEGRCSLPSR